MAHFLSPPALSASSSHWRQSQWQLPCVFSGLAPSVRHPACLLRTSCPRGHFDSSILLSSSRPPLGPLPSLHPQSRGQSRCRAAGETLSRLSRGRGLATPSLPALSELAAFSSPSRRRDVRVRAVDYETYWITAAQALGVVFGIAGCGVFVGFLLALRVEKQSEAEVRQLLAEGRTPEEILALGIEQMKEAGLTLELPNYGSQRGESVSDPLQPSLEEDGQTLSGGDDGNGLADFVPSASSSLASGNVGRRRRPQRGDD